MTFTKRTVWSAAVAVGLIAGATGSATAQQALAPAATSPAKVKELIALLVSRKLETFAAPENGPKFVAVLHVPGVQLLLASASYGRPLDFDYYLFHKKYQDMYQELKSSPLSVEKFFVEDTLADGLVVIPGKSTAIDVVTVGGDRRTFDGDFADPTPKEPEEDHAGGLLQGVLSGRCPVRRAPRRAHRGIEEGRELGRVRRTAIS